MHSRHRLFLAGGMLAGAVALGCQAPSPVSAPSGPRVLAKAGVMELSAATDLALQFRQPCADGNPKYDLQALDARIAKIRLKIVGPSYPDGKVLEISRDDFEDECTFNQLFEDLLVGDYTLTMLGLNAEGKGVMQQKEPKTVTVTESAPAAIVLKCDFSNGDLEVTIDCCSPPPSATPTPEPTPTPETIVIEPMLHTHGFTVDTQGRPYVFGWDGGSGSTMTGTQWGRMYRFTPGVPAPSPTPYYDDIDAIVEGSILDDTFIGAVNASAGATRMTLDLTAANPTPAFTLASGTFGLYANFAANALDPVADKLHIAFGVFLWPSFYEHTVVYEETSGTQSYNSGSLPPQTISKLPYTMEWSGSLEKPVWTGQDGVFKPGASASAAPEKLVEGPAFGLVTLDGGDVADEGLLTRWGWSLDPSIFYYNAADDGDPLTPDVATAKLTFTHGFPRTIERGADGHYYVMLYENGAAVTNQNAYNHLVRERFRIVKLKWNGSTKVLEPDYVVVDNFADTSPSW